MLISEIFLFLRFKYVVCCDLMIAVVISHCEFDLRKCSLEFVVSRQYAMPCYFRCFFRAKTFGSSFSPTKVGNFSMLACAERSSMLCLESFFPSISLSRRMISDRISEAYKSPLKKSSQTDEKDGAPSYVIKASYGDHILKQRIFGADAGSGIQPTKWQKRFLVITRVYKNQAEIPPYIASGTMARMHNRMRVLFIFVAVIIFYIVFFIAEITNSNRIDRDRDAGIVVKKMPFLHFGESQSVGDETNETNSLCTLSDQLGQFNTNFAVIFLHNLPPTNMEVFRKVFMNSTTVQKSFDDSTVTENSPREQISGIEKEGRYSGIPAIPSDIAFSSGKDIAGKKKSGVASQMARNPTVILGMGLTTLALLGMLKSSFIGDKLGTQKYMRYRIIAQFFTVTALVAGVTIFGSTYKDDDVVKSKASVQKPEIQLNKQ
ncbi:hypoxia induced protein region [Dictyocaulus viviparus]|uniref:Hypoxia induced protein region n=1 Tax=Dictyocaulus viviparus TaxID=29172 RepID=A0A0D8XGD3_DICVI|nr:hypoxia induced protein region [Dictyocaulus viviparus]